MCVRERGELGALVIGGTLQSGFSVASEARQYLDYHHLLPWSLGRLLYFSDGW